MRIFSKIIIIVILLPCILCSCVLFSCGYVSYKDYYDIDDYSEIWQLSGFSQEYDEDNKIFPSAPDKEHTKSFFCRYDQQLPLGEGFQIFLEFQYDNEELFEEERERLSNIAFDCKELANKKFSAAFATCTDTEKYLEYALIENESMTIYYVYIQDVPLKQIEISQEFLLSNME